MLVIRAEQYRILNLACEAAFRKEVAAYLEADFAEQCKQLGPEGVTDLIELGIRKAAQYGIELESGICDLIAVMAEFGPRVDEQEWAASILRDGAEPANVRVGRLVGWAEAMRNLNRRS
jgi:hypothetical protein